MREKLIVFYKGKPLSINELAEISGLPPPLLRSRNRQIIDQSSQTRVYKSKRRAVFTEDDLRPVGEPRKTPVQREEPAPASFTAILNKAFGCKYG